MRFLGSRQVGILGMTMIEDLSNVYDTEYMTINNGGDMKLSNVVKQISSLKSRTSNGKLRETFALLKILTDSKQNIKLGKEKSLDEIFASLEKRIRAFKK